MAAVIGDTPDGVVELACGTDLQVAFVGFAPGFPYLVGLPPALATVPRRATPRVSVPAGLGGRRRWVRLRVPGDHPGRMALLGHTTVRLFDPDRPPYAVLRAGDTSGSHRLARTATGPGGPTGSGITSPRPLVTARGGRYVEVVDPGLLSLIEDGGRRQVAAMGVPRAGPADPDSMRLANRLVGNPDGAAAIEVTALGPTLRFIGPATSPWCPPGLTVRRSCRRTPVTAGVVIPVRDGQVVTVGRIRGGLRAYLSVSGGFDDPDRSWARGRPTCSRGWARGRS